MPTDIYIQNNLSSALSVSTSVNPSLSSSYWAVTSNNAPSGVTTEMLWMDRNEGIKDDKTWYFTSSFTFAGVQIQLQEQLTGTFSSSDIQIQIVAGSNSTGFSSNNISQTFTGTDGSINRITGTYSLDGSYDNVTYAITQVSSGGILPQIDHIVVLMDENRSMDNLLGWLYASGTQPSQFIPSGSGSTFEGLTTNGFSNSDPSVNSGNPVDATSGTTGWTIKGTSNSEWVVPSPDPGEEFDDVNQQLFNGQPTANNSGFLTNYVTQVNSAGGPASSAAQIMQSYSPSQVPVISFLAQSFATSDAWYSSMPTQTWPNRGFLLTGSSDGTTNNDDYLPWDINTVFDALGNQNINWMVYNDGSLPSLVKTMFLTKYIFNETNFGSIEDFQTACSQPSGAPATSKLPPFTFLEPNFGVTGTDESYHPPHDVRPGEQFLQRIYEIIQASPYRDNILFVLLFDEHGGTYDHVTPPSGAKPPYPDPVATDGSGFTYTRFGVRIPAIVVSSYVQPGTVFRTSTSVPLDHTSILATVRDWLGLSNTFASMLPSPRIVAAPNIASVLTETTPQSWPAIPAASDEMLAEIDALEEPDDDEPLNDVHRAQLTAAAQIVAKRTYTAAEAIGTHNQLRTYRDARSFLMALQAHLPLK